MEVSCPVHDIGIIKFHGMAPATDEMLMAMQMWMRGEVEPPAMHRDEWLCLYCGGAQPLHSTKCTNCGAARTWLLG